MTNCVRSICHPNIPLSEIDYLALKKCDSFVRTDITGLYRLTADSFQQGTSLDLPPPDTLEFLHELHDISRMLCNCLIHRTFRTSIL